MVKPSRAPKEKLVELSSVVGCGRSRPAVFDWDRDKASSHDGREAQQWYDGGDTVEMSRQQ